MAARITSGWGNYWKLKDFFKGKLPIKTKTEIWRSSIQPTVTYRAKTWALTESNVNKLRVTQRAMERSILNIEKKEKMEHKIIRAKRYRKGGKITKVERR